MITALTIASSDSCSGAGIQADLRAFQSIGIHGGSVVVAVTAQNTLGIRKIHPLPPEAVRAQIDAVFEDMSPNAVKTGMLYSSEIARAVCSFLKGRDIPLVVDPVLRSTTGSSLHSKEYASALRELVSMATLVTPNIHEAEVLSGIKIRDAASLKKAADNIKQLGCGYVLIKGGHMRGGRSTDFLFDGHRFLQFQSKRFSVGLHGAGCAYSALITGFLAKGISVPESVRAAKKLISRGIENSYAIGKGGLNIPNTLPKFPAEKSRQAVETELNRAVVELSGLDFPKILMPRVRINFGYALPSARSYDEVCAIPGRFRMAKGKLVPGAPKAELGASKHVATIILTAMQYDRTMRSAMNVKYSENAVAACRKAGFQVGTFSRDDEPPGFSSMEWGTAHAIKSLGKAPDVIYDKGSADKEAMIRILGKRPKDVLSKLKKIMGSLEQ